MKKHLIGLALLLSAQVGFAADLNFINRLIATEMENFAEDIGAIITYRSVNAPEAQGLLGFDIGAVLTATKIQNDSLWGRVTADSAPTYIIVPKLQAQKGLPFGIDVGLSLSKAANTNISLLGAEIRYALLEGSTVTPALGIRGTYSRLSGVDQLDADAKGLEISISKGILLFTPYAGIGKIWSTVTPKEAAAFLPETEVDFNRIFIGTRIALTLLNIAIEAEKIGDTQGVSVKLGINF